ncbi:DUF1579 family protein [Edaphobacter aggregans]|uniref:DUF1579 family protein n=1 Tax=Edaphobacter aggregans TaxID=570835 RepID=UPI000A04707F|nr:DUF1579 family protein [Edaphobacter aggregans]
MRRLFVRVVLSAVLAGFTASALAQETPKPALELKKLDSFVGSWKVEGEMKPGPMGPGGKISGSDTWGWMAGNFFLVNHSKFEAAGMGAGSATAFMGYDTDKKVYTYDEFNSMGETVHSTGTVEGDTWTWLGDTKMGPQRMKGRFTVVIQSPTSHSFKFEVSQDGSTWSTVMEGKATKVK